MTYGEWKKITGRIINGMEVGLFKPKEMITLLDFLRTVNEQDFEKAVKP